MLKKLKKLCFLIALVILILPVYATADSLGNANLYVTYSGPVQSVTFTGATSYPSYYADYDGVWNLFGTQYSAEIFCVENAALNGNNPFQFFTVDNSLSNYGLDASDFINATWIANSFWNVQNANDTAKAAAQLAIWEVVIETSSSYDLSAGIVKSTGGVTSAAQNILNNLSLAIQSGTNDDFAGNWLLAVNPVVGLNGQINVQSSQNYLVPTAAPVPEPATILFVGIGLAGIGQLGRKKLAKKKLKQ